MKIRQRTRSRFDINREFAAKQLPAHPVSRYHCFSELWKTTRRKGGYVPIPNNTNDGLFPCCLNCQSQNQINSKTDAPNQPLWHRKANAGWLQAEWKWDFGHTLPPDFVKYGVGITSPLMPIDKNKIFFLDESSNRVYINENLEEHATLPGDRQHEAKMRITLTPLYNNVDFVGQMTASNNGTIAVAVLRDPPFGDGVAIYDRYIYQYIEMPYNLPVLITSNFVVNADRISLNGIPLN